MASLGALGWLSAGATLLEVYSMTESAKLARIEGERRRVAYEFAKAEGERMAGTAIAISQRQAFEERRQANLVASRALAVSAASGGGVSDPTIVNLIARTKGEGVYRANVALYEGEARARELRIQGAMGNVDTGEARAAGYKLAALGAAIKGGSSLYAKYGLDGPGSGPSSGSGDSALLDAGSTDLLTTG